MKIGLLVPTLERGGTERQVSLLALALSRRGHSVTVITFRPGGELGRDLENTGVVLRSLAGGRLEPASYLVGLTSWIVAEAPDALYSFLPPSNVIALIAGFLGRKCRICWGVRSANMPLQGYGLKTRLAYKLERALSGFPDCIIVNSQAGLAA